MILSIRQVEIENEDTGETTVGYRLCNADGQGYGDVSRAVDINGYHRMPRSRPHPALGVFATREEAVDMLEQLGAELAEKCCGAFEVA